MSANAKSDRSRQMARSRSPKIYLFNSKYNKDEARKIKLMIVNGRAETDQINAKLEDK